LKPIFICKFFPCEGEEEDEGIRPVGGVEEYVHAIDEVEDKVEKQNQDEG
jgi:hypothetical protein